MKYKDNNLSGVTSPQVDILLNVINTLRPHTQLGYIHTLPARAGGIYILYRGPKKEMRYGAEF